MSDKSAIVWRGGGGDARLSHIWEKSKKNQTQSPRPVWVTLRLHVLLCQSLVCVGLGGKMGAAVFECSSRGAKLELNLREQELYDTREEGACLCKVEQLVVEEDK